MRCTGRSPTTAPASTVPESVHAGHGFVNMRDRMGAFGGTLEVVSDGTGHDDPRPCPAALS